MKKLIILMAVVIALMTLPAYAVLVDSCAMNNPSNNVTFNNGVITLNATAVWSSTAQGPTNLLNVSFFVFGNGTTVQFLNSTSNGTRSNATAGAVTLKGDFTYTLVAADLVDNVAYSIAASCYNMTDNQSNNALNSSVLTYTIDTLAPSTLITTPLSGSTVVPSNNVVTFQYTPTDTNLANCTLHLNNVATASTTSSTTTPNVTSGSPAKLSHTFGGDNTSVRAAIVCNDLAGISGTTSNFTFNVLLGATPLAVRQAQAAAAAAGGGGSLLIKTQTQPSAAGQRFSAVSSQTAGSSHFQQYGWMYIVGILLFAGIAIKLKWFK